MMLYQSESKACFRLALLAWSHMALRCLCSHQKFGVTWILWTRLQLGMRKAVFINLKNSRIITVFSESEIHSVVFDSLQPHGLYSSWNSLGQNTEVGSLSLIQGIFPTQGSNPGLLHCRWILYQLSHNGSPRILEWVAYPFSSGSSQHRNQTESPALQADFLPTELSKCQ